MSIKGTKSEKNLQAALTGESLARNKYSFYAIAARKEGLDDIAESLERMAKNEMMHAKFWYEQLYGSPDNTRENLIRSIGDELKEAGQMYPDFAKEAREEGLEELAKMFESVARIEEGHAKQFMRLLQEAYGAQEKDADLEALAAKAPVQPTEGYRCMFCGAVFPERPDVCGVCKAIGAFEYCN